MDEFSITFEHECENFINSVWNNGPGFTNFTAPFGTSTDGVFTYGTGFSGGPCANPALWTFTVDEENSMGT
jgi:hypothetical protein